MSYVSMYLVPQKKKAEQCQERGKLSAIGGIDGLLW